MANFPTDFDTTTRPLKAEGLGPAGAQAINQLAERGYQVHTGLTPEYAQAILAMAHEPHIREFCPKDLDSRFTDQAAARKWLAKGRGTFLLLNDGQLVGYGWSGDGPSSHVTGSETTFSIRIGQAGQGQGLAAPFSQAIIYGSQALYGAKSFSLSCWQSNGAAVHVYHKVGFQDVTEQPIERQTADGQTTDDVRVYMSLPNELLK